MSYTPTTWVEKTTKVGPTNLNKIETALTKMPYGPDMTGANDVPVWNGTAFVRASGTPDATKFLRGDASWAAPPGYDFGSYAEKATDTSILGTTSTAPTTIVTAPAITFDGSTVVYIRFYCHAIQRGTSNIQIGVYEDGLYLKNIAYSEAAGFVPGGVFQMRRTPAAGSRTYSIRAFVDAGTGIVGGNQVPAHIVIVKA